MIAISKIRRQGKIFILADNMLVVFGFFAVFPLISLHFIDQLGWAASLVGMSLALRQFVQQGLAIGAGSLADRFGAKPLIVAGMLLRAAGFVVMAQAHTLWWLVISCLLSGLGGALFDPPRAALIAKFTRPAERNRFYALLISLESACAVGGALAGGWLLRFDFAWVGWMGGMVFALAALGNAVLIPNYRVSIRRSQLLHGIGQVLADRPFRNFVLTLSGYYLLGAQIMLLVPITLKQLSGTSEAVSWMYTLDTLLSLALLYPLARLGEKYASLNTRISLGLALMTLSMLMLAFTHTLPLVFVLLALFYIGSIVAEPARETLIASQANPHHRATYMGFSKIGLALGGAAGHIGGGWLYDLGRIHGEPRLPWLVLACIGATTLLTLQWQFRRRSRLLPA